MHFTQGTFLKAHYYTSGQFSMQAADKLAVIWRARWGRLHTRVDGSRGDDACDGTAHVCREAHSFQVQRVVGTQCLQEVALHC